MKMNKITNIDTEEDASRKACELLRKHFISESHPNYEVYDDDYIIKNYPDEWSWLMQGWHEKTKLGIFDVTHQVCAHFGVAKEEGDEIHYYCNKCGIRL